MEMDTNLVVVVAKHQNTFRWFRCDREFWVLDRHKWRDSFVAAGFQCPEEDGSDRFGIAIASEKNASEFLEKMWQFSVDKTQLAAELRSRFDSATSWWDVGDLFPVMFVDFDSRRVAAFYPDGIRFEKYIPDGWFGEFEDFATVYPEGVFPSAEKFWIQEGLDLLEQLNVRGSQLKKCN